MKLYLLIAGDCYYPQSGTNNWIACFETYAQAEAEVTKEALPRILYSKGPRKGQINEEYPEEFRYFINGRTYGWYGIINLREWTGEVEYP